jgi:hypothetical protein
MVKNISVQSIHSLLYCMQETEYSLQIPKIYSLL